MWIHNGTCIPLCKYSFVPLAYSFINLTYTQASGTLQELPVKVETDEASKFVFLFEAEIEEDKGGRQV